MLTFRHSVLVLALLSAPYLPARADTCDPSVFGDGVCDCGCGTRDSDCAAGTFVVCKVSHCAAGQVPWHQTPSSCMTSACGDGWKDTAAGEACDDGNALAGGGCSADCQTVTAGYECGERAAGCHLIFVDAGPETDAGVTADAGTPTEAADAGSETQVPAQGCATAPAPMLMLGAMTVWGARRRRGRSPQAPLR